MKKPGRKEGENWRGGGMKKPPGHLLIKGANLH
jgi:hypothetical protein